MCSTVTGRPAHEGRAPASCDVRRIRRKTIESRPTVGVDFKATPRRWTRFGSARQRIGRALAAAFPLDPVGFEVKGSMAQLW